MASRRPIYPDLMPKPVSLKEWKRRNRLPQAEQVRIHAFEEFKRQVACGEVPATPLRLARLHAGLTQRELAERSYLTPGSISTFDRGDRRPPMRSAVHIAHALTRASGKLIEPADLWPELEAAASQ